MNLAELKVGLIGCGNLASSLVKGLKKLEPAVSIYVNDVMEEKAEAFARENGAFNLSLNDLLHITNVVILAVKPNNIKEILSEIKEIFANCVPDNFLLISVAAGIGLWYYEENLPGFSVIRTMPNTSASMGQAITGLVRGKHVTDEQVAIASTIFEGVGKVLWVEDSKINALTAVSGSGPAYFYLFTELMCKAGVKLGLTEEEAFALSSQTLVGAGRMIESGKSPKELRLSVTSPNGTTHAAIEKMLEDGLEETVFNAMKKCSDRAFEMEKDFTK